MAAVSAKASWKCRICGYGLCPACLRQVLTYRKCGPHAKYKFQCNRSYPITVTVAVMEGDHKANLWSGSQRNLFRKYGAKRREAMDAIEAAVKAYRPK